ncbi:MAG: hypothetical protein GY820_01890 [Gammaproteobacteria bacterium]|nr:hypothetical protein [Gammaproteobacteria bacterium]
MPNDRKPPLSEQVENLSKLVNDLSTTVNELKSENVQLRETVAQLQRQILEKQSSLISQIEGALAPVLDTIQNATTNLSTAATNLQHQQQPQQQHHHQQQQQQQQQQQKPPIPWSKEYQINLLVNALDAREKDQCQKAEKAKNAVVVGLPENEDENGDFEMVSKLCSAANINLDKLSKTVRHGRVNENRARILKCYFTDESTRNSFLRQFRSVFRSVAGFGGHVFCRRDMTDRERQFDFELRQECRQRNDQEGWQRWTVRDFEIFERRPPLSSSNRNHHQNSTNQQQGEE